jgi:hypothetical protein
MNTYFIFVGGAIALIGGVFLIQTLGKNADETVWIMRALYQLKHRFSEDLEKSFC